MTAPRGVLATADGRPEVAELRHRAGRGGR